MARGPARAGVPGGIAGYPLTELRREVAFIAYHFHWDHDRILELEHADRRGWVEQISSMNQERNQAS